MELRQAKQLATRLMVEHGVAPSLFKFTNGKCQLGSCKWRRIFCGEPTLQSIGLSRFLVVLNDEEEIRLTMLHEIAHALVGCDHGHDSTWKLKVMEIGGDPSRLNSTANIPKGRYLGVCPICGEKHYRYRFNKRNRYSTYRCLKDGGKFQFVDTGKVVTLVQASRSAK